MNSGVSLFPKTAFFSDVTITSSFRSVVKVLMGHFTIFQSHGLSGWFMPKIIKSFLNMSKLRPKYCRSIFWDTVYIKGHSRSLEMAPLDRSHTSSYSCSIVTMVVSCIVFEIERDIDRIWHFFITLLRNNPLAKTVANIFALFFFTTKQDPWRTT